MNQIILIIDGPKQYSYMYKKKPGHEKQYLKVFIILFTLYNLTDQSDQTA